MSIYVKIRQWFQPYWRPVPEELKQLDNKNNKSENVKDSSLDKDSILSRFKRFSDKKNKLAINRKKKENEIIDEDHPELVMRIFQTNKPLDNVMKSTQKPKRDTMWYYHDSNRHQIYAHLMPGTGFRVPSEERSDRERSKLKPKVRPVKSPGFDEAYDRTHLIPFGYHGSENDPRLVIGWSRAENRNGLADFEMRAKKISVPIYWLTDVRKLKYGAIWRYVVCEAESGKELMKYISKMGSPERPVKFDWSED